MDDQSDSPQEVFTCSLSSNYADQVPNQTISSTKSEHVTKAKIYQPIENKNVNSTHLKHEFLTMNEMLIDKGNSMDIIDENTIDRIQSKVRKIRLFKTKKKLYPYASNPKKLLGNFESVIENEKRYTITKLCVIKNKDI